MKREALAVSQKIAVAKSPLRSLTRILANKRRKLVQRPGYNSWQFPLSGESNSVAVNRRGRITAPANRERKFPVCPCRAGEEGNRREPYPAIRCKNLLAESFSDRPPPRSSGREDALA